MGHVAGDRAGADVARRSRSGGGLAGARADRDLDAVVALFDAAARYVDRLPQMGPRGFLDHIRGQDVPGDTLVARAPSDDTVALLTPQGAAGREWSFVVVAGRPGGRVARPAAARLAARLRAAGRRR